MTDSRACPSCGELLTPGNRDYCGQCGKWAGEPTERHLQQAREFLDQLFYDRDFPATDRLAALLAETELQHRAANGVLRNIGQHLETAAPMTMSHARPHIQSAIRLWRSWRDAPPPVLDEPDPPGPITPGVGGSPMTDSIQEAAERLLERFDSEWFDHDEVDRYSITSLMAAAVRECAGLIRGTRDLGIIMDTGVILRNSTRNICADELEQLAAFLEGRE